MCAHDQIVAQLMGINFEAQLVLANFQRILNPSALNFFNQLIYNGGGCKNVKVHERIAALVGFIVLIFQPFDWVQIALLFLGFLVRSLLAKCANLNAEYRWLRHNKNEAIATGTKHESAKHLMKLLFRQWKAAQRNFERCFAR